MQILVNTPLDPYTGYGRDGVGMITALMRAGHDVHLFTNRGVQPPLPRHIAALFAKERPSNIDLAIVADGPLSLKVERSIRRLSPRVVG